MTPSLSAPRRCGRQMCSVILRWLGMWRTGHETIRSHSCLPSSWRLPALYILALLLAGADIYFIIHYVQRKHEWRLVCEAERILSHLNESADVGHCQGPLVSETESSLPLNLFLHDDVFLRVEVGSYAVGRACKSCHNSPWRTFSRPEASFS